jgi:hypothetical protein
MAAWIMESESIDFSSAVSSMFVHCANLDRHFASDISPAHGFCASKMFSFGSFGGSHSLPRGQVSEGLLGRRISVRHGRRDLQGRHQNMIILSTPASVRGAVGKVRFSSGVATFVAGCETAPRQPEERDVVPLAAWYIRRHGTWRAWVTTMQ